MWRSAQNKIQQNVVKTKIRWKSKTYFFSEKISNVFQKNKLKKIKKSGTNRTFFSKTKYQTFSEKSHFVSKKSQTFPNVKKKHTHFQEKSKHKNKKIPTKNRHFIFSKFQILSLLQHHVLSSIINLNKYGYIWIDMESWESFPSV